MRATSIVVFTAFVLATAAIAGTTGRLRGLVTEGQTPLPGVTVSVTSPTQIGGAQVEMTDSNGMYSFNNLTPGTFTATFTLDGFATQEAKNIQVRLDGTTELNVAMSQARVSETITVTAEAPTVDPEKVSITQTFNHVYLENVAISSANRSYQAIMGQAAGVVGTSNPNVFGSTLGENAYYIDGVNTTDPVTATFGVNFNFDAISEIALRTAGYEAEYGGATGGFVNLVTKSGGNEFSGSADVRYRTNDFIEKGKYFDPGQRKEKFLTPGVTLGGPILRDRLWFFTAYQYTDSRSTPESSPTTRKFVGNYYLGKLTWQANPSWLLSGKFSSDPADIDHSNAGRDIPEVATSFQTQGGNVAQADLTGVLTPNLLWNLRGGISRQKLDAYPQSGNFDLAGHTDYNEVLPPSVNYTNAQYSNRDRDQALSDISWSLPTKRGDHQLKAGVEFDDLKFKSQNYTVSGYRYQDDGTAPYVLWYEPNPGASESKGKSYGAFAQDGWQVNERLTVSAGVRYDSVSFTNDLGTKVADYGKVQPRIGAAFDFSGKATTVARVSWGRFMHPSALTMPSFAKQKSLPSFAYLSCSAFGFSREACQSRFSGTLTRGGLTVPRWIDDPQRTDPNGYLLSSNNVFSSLPNEVDPNLKPTYADALVLGIAHQFGHRTSIDVSYVHKNTRDIFEDTCNGNVPTPTADAPCDFYIMTNLPQLKRDYDGLILQLESHAYPWLNVVASYTYSKSQGSVEYTQNAGTDFDVYPVHYVNTYGYLSDDRRHRVKVNGYSELPHGFTVGFSAFWSSPFAYSKTTPVSPYGTEFVAPRGSFRANSNYQLDLEVRKEFRIGNVRPQIIASALNVLGQELVTGVCTNAEGCSGDVAFGGATSHSTPRRYEVGFRLTF
ncbi:MAG: TonB-dependent receptor [Acidobacteriota bacterium]